MIEWLRKWWWVIGLVGVAIAVWALTGGKVPLDIGAEVNAAKAQANAKKLQAKLGRDAAKKQIEEDYAETINDMDEADKQQVEKLKDDPGKRARFYARVATKRARRSSA